MRTIHDHTIRLAVETIEVMQAYWQETDPDFDAVLPYLIRRMKDVGADYPPAMWPQLVEMNYLTVKLVMQGFTEVNEMPGDRCLSSLLH